MTGRYGKFLVQQGEVFSREVKLGGEMETVYFVKVPYTTWHRWISDSRSENPDVRDAAEAYLVGQALCEPDGTLALTIEQSMSLTPEAIKLFLPLIVDINQPKATEEGNA